MRGAKSVAVADTAWMITLVGAIDASVGNAASNRKETRIASDSARRDRGEFSSRGTRARTRLFSSRMHRLLPRAFKENDRRKERKSIRINLHMQYTQPITVLPALPVEDDDD